MLTTDAALQRVKGIKKSFNNAVKNKLEQYEDNRVINFYPTSEISEIYTSTESIGGMVKLGEREAPPVRTLDDGYSVTLTEERYGEALSLSESVARMPPLILGCKVLTRPPSISGEPVYSSTVFILVDSISLERSL